MGALEPADGDRLLRRGIERRQPFQRTELFISSVSAVGGPVVVGLEVQVLVFTGGEGVPKIQHRRAFPDAGENIIQHGVFVDHRGARRQFLGVDRAGRRRQQKSHFPRVVGREISHRFHVFVHLREGGVRHGKQFGEQPAILAQQNAAFLHFLECDLIRCTLGIDPLVAQQELVLHPAGKIALPASVQKIFQAEVGELCGTPVLQFYLRPLGPEEIEYRNTDQQKQPRAQQRIPGTTAFLTVNHFVGHDPVCPPFHIRNWRTAPLCWWRLLRKRCTAPPEAGTKGLSTGGSG